MSICSSNKDCLSTETCIASKCAVQQTNQLSTGAYIGIGVGAVVVLGIIIAICVRSKRSNKRNKYSESLDKAKNSQDQGPAPLPRGYMKPVDLLQVAEQNRRMEEVEQLQMIQKQNQLYKTQQMYQTEALDGRFVAVPVNQVYEFSQNSPILQTVRSNNPNSAQYIEQEQYGSTYSHPGMPPVAQTFSANPYKANNGVVRNGYIQGAPAPVNIVGTPQYMMSNSFEPNQSASPKLYVDQDGNPYSYPVAPKRSESPQKLQSRPSNSSIGSKSKNFDIPQRIIVGGSPQSPDKSNNASLVPGRRDSSVSSNSVRSGKNLPSLPTVQNNFS